MDPVWSAVRAVVVCLLEVVPFVVLQKCAAPGLVPMRLNQFTVCLAVVAVVAIFAVPPQRQGSRQAVSGVSCASAGCGPVCGRRSSCMALKATQQDLDVGPIVEYLEQQACVRMFQEWAPLVWFWMTHSMEPLVEFVTTPKSNTSSSMQICRELTTFPWTLVFGVLVEVVSVVKAAEAVLVTWLGPGGIPRLGVATVLMAAATAATVVNSGVWFLRVVEPRHATVPEFVAAAMFGACVSVFVLLAVQSRLAVAEKAV
jgi:hypothetical protein